MDLTAYKEDVLPLKHKLYRYAVSILHSAADAEDAVQEVLLKVWNQREQLEGVHSIEGWIVRVMRNHCLDVIKSKKRHHLDIDNAYDLHSSNASPEAYTEWKDAYGSVSRIIKTLPQAQQEVLFLREVEQKTYKEICTVTGMTLDSVKVSIFRARKTVREQYQKIAAYGN